MAALVDNREWHESGSFSTTRDQVGKMGRKLITIRGSVDIITSKKTKDKAKQNAATTIKNILIYFESTLDHISRQFSIKGYTTTLISMEIPILTTHLPRYGYRWREFPNLQDIVDGVCGDTVIPRWITQYYGIAKPVYTVRNNLTTVTAPSTVEDVRPSIEDTGRDSQPRGRSMSPVGHSDAGRSISSYRERGRQYHAAYRPATTTPSAYRDTGQGDTYPGPNTEQPGRTRFEPASTGAPRQGHQQTHHRMRNESVGPAAIQPIPRVGVAGPLRHEQASAMPDVVNGRALPQHGSTASMLSHTKSTTIARLGSAHPVYTSSRRQGTVAETPEVESNADTTAHTALGSLRQGLPQPVSESIAGQSQPKRGHTRPISPPLNMTASQLDYIMAPTSAGSISHSDILSMPGIASVLRDDSHAPYKSRSTSPQDVMRTTPQPLGPAGGPTPEMIPLVDSAQMRDSADIDELWWHDIKPSLELDSIPVKKHHTADFMLAVNTEVEDGGFGVYPALLCLPYMGGALEGSTLAEALEKRLHDSPSRWVPCWERNVPVHSIIAAKQELPCNNGDLPRFAHSCYNKACMLPEHTFIPHPDISDDGRCEFVPRVPPYDRLIPLYCPTHGTNCRPASAAIGPTAIAVAGWMHYHGYTSLAQVPHARLGRLTPEMLNTRLDTFRAVVVQDGEDENYHIHFSHAKTLLEYINRQGSAGGPQSQQTPERRDAREGDNDPAGGSDSLRPGSTHPDPPDHASDHSEGSSYQPNQPQNSRDSDTGSSWHSPDPGNTSAREDEELSPAQNDAGQSMSDSRLRTKQTDNNQSPLHPSGTSYMTALSLTAPRGSLTDKIFTNTTQRHGPVIQDPDLETGGVIHCTQDTSPEHKKTMTPRDRQSDLEEIQRQSLQDWLQSDDAVEYFKRCREAGGWAGPHGPACILCISPYHKGLSASKRHMIKELSFENARGSKIRTLTTHIHSHDQAENIKATALYEMISRIPWLCECPIRAIKYALADRFPITQMIHSRRLVVCTLTFSCQLLRTIVSLTRGFVPSSTGESALPDGPGVSGSAFNARVPALILVHLTGKQSLTGH